MAGAKEAEFGVVDDEDMWVSAPHFSSSNPLHSGLKDLEHSLRCPICQEFMTAPVSVVPCQHSFCSECIRTSFKMGMRSLKRQALCPVCREQVKDSPPLFSKSLVPNRSMELVIRKFQALRGNLRDALQQNSAGTASAANAAVAATKSDNSTAAPDTEVSWPRRSKRTNYAEDDIDDDDEFVPEPIAAATATAPPVQRKKMVPPQYSKLKKKQLKEICAKEGLSSAGNEAELKKRHEAFVSLYNSECDSFHPRSHAELVQVITSREQECKKEATKSRYNGSGNHAQCMEQLKQSRKVLGEQEAAASVVSSGNEAFDAEIKSNFAKLMQQAKQNMKKKSESDDDVDKSTENGDSKQPARSTDTNNGESKENAGSDDTVQPEESGMESEATSDPFIPKCITEVQAAMAQTTSGVADKDSEATSKQSTEPSPSQPQGSFASAATTRSSGETGTASSASAIASSNATNDTTKRKGTLNVSRASKKKAKVAPIARERRTSAGGSIIGPWTCHVCTFRNTTRTYSKAKCEMCSTPRQSGTNGSGNDFVAIDC